jgi:hypothetical protein
MFFHPYIATAIQGCGCHTRDKSDGSKNASVLTKNRQTDIK